MIRIRIKEDLQKGAPGYPGQTFQYKKGEEIVIKDIEYPGKTLLEGIVGWMVSETKAADDWAFWTNFSIDHAIIFAQKEIDLLILTENDKAEWKGLLNAPKTFEVRFEPDF